MNNGSNKRQAHLGQWTTPPQPFFPNTSNASSGNAQGGNNNNSAGDNGGGNANNNSSIQTFDIPLPPGMDPNDFAAFQEAYRRGAEAAAALAQPTHPNHAAAQRALFAAGFAAAQQQQKQQHQTGDQPMNYSQDQANIQTQQPPSSLMAATAASMQPASSNQNLNQPLQQPSMMQSTNNVPHHPEERLSILEPTHVVSSNTVSTSNPTPPPSTVNFNINNADLTPNPVTGLNSGQGSVGTGGMSSAASRSISLPDMARYAARATAEDHKRKKRLARNRASARLRRLKKKNLVDTYEGEVGVLEAALAKLQAHSWGSDHDHEALLEALTMDRGQQPLTPEKRQALIHDILKQQREQVQSIRDVHFEVMLLGWLANQNEGGDESIAKKEVVTEPQAKAEMEEEEALAKELNEILCLTSNQKTELKKATQTTHEELKAIETVDMCLEAMLNNSWIMNHPVEEITQQFMSILNTGQMSKFLLWTDHNAEAIDQLDYVNAPPASSTPAQSPTFVFGTDNEGAHFHGDSNEGDESKQ